jgi:hypothetical protein
MHIRANTAATGSITQGWAPLGAGLLGLCLLCLMAAVGASGAAAASAPCRAIRSEAQLEHVNKLVQQEETVQELDSWGQHSIRLSQVSRHGAATKLRLVHAKQGKSHIAFDYSCQAVLVVATYKRQETCEPDPVAEKVTCAKHWFTTSKKETWIHIDRPISLHIPTGRDRATTVEVAMVPWFIPGKYVLNVESQTPALRYGFK